MSVFRDPQEHAANPPESWQVRKACERVWRLTTASGAVLESFTTKHAAERAKHDGFLARLYEQETRWYAGEAIPGWRPYAAVKA